MMRQGTFIADFFPDDIKAQIADGDLSNADFFQLPSPEGTDPAMLGGGDLVGAFSKNDATKQVVEYITSKEFGTNGYAEPGDLHLAARGLRRDAVLQRDPEEGGGHPCRHDAVRLRRLRPDAGRGGRRHRVDVPHAVVRGAVDDAERVPADRRLLAGELTADDRARRRRARSSDHPTDIPHNAVRRYRCRSSVRSSPSPQASRSPSSSTGCSTGWSSERMRDGRRGCCRGSSSFRSCCSSSSSSSTRSCALSSRASRGRGLDVARATRSSDSRTTSSCSRARCSSPC